MAQFPFSGGHLVVGEAVFLRAKEIVAEPQEKQTGDDQNGILGLQPQHRVITKDQVSTEAAKEEVIRYGRTEERKEEVASIRDAIEEEHQVIQSDHQIDRQQ